MLTFHLSRILCTLVVLLLQFSSHALSCNLTPKEPLKAQANLEIKLETTKWGGEIVESKVVASVAAKFAVAPIHIIKIPSYEGVLEDATIQTPVSMYSNFDFRHVNRAIIPP